MPSSKNGSNGSRRGRSARKQPSKQHPGQHATQRAAAGRVPRRLVVIGGRESRTGNAEILRTFVELAGGAKAHILVIPVATTLDPLAYAREYARHFRHLGAATVEALEVPDRATANKPESVEMIGRATGVFFTGGDQLRITSTFGGTASDTALRRRFHEGIVIAGTSAGATMMSSSMILADPTETRIDAQVEMGPGMEYLPGLVVDQHFSQRGRMHRLVSAVARFPHYIGIGIDENTAMVVEDDEFRVIGQGAVTIVDAGQATFNNMASIAPNERATLCGLLVHVLPAGSGFRFSTRKPVVAAGRKPSSPRLSTHQPSTEQAALAHQK